MHNNSNFAGKKLNKDNLIRVNTLNDICNKEPLNLKTKLYGNENANNLSLTQQQQQPSNDIFLNLERSINIKDKVIENTTNSNIKNSVTVEFKSKLGLNCSNLN